MQQSSAVLVNAQADALGSTTITEGDVPRKDVDEP